MALASASVTVTYYLQNKAALDAAGPFSIADGAASIAAHLDELNADPNVASISFPGPPFPANGTALTLTLAQVLNDTRALSLFTSTACIAATSSAAGIEALDASQIAQFSRSNCMVTQLKVTDADVDLTAAQKSALGAYNIAIVQPYSGGSVEVMRYQATGLTASISYRGIVGQSYTDYTISYGPDGKPTTASYSDGTKEIWTYNSDGSSYTTWYGSDNKPTSASFSDGLTKIWSYNADGSYSIAYTGVSGHNYTSYAVDYGADCKPVSASYGNGMTASYTYLANGAYDVLYVGVTGEPYSDYETHYGSDGKIATAFYDNGMMATWTYNPNGTHSVEYDGVTGQAYSSYTVDYGTNGKPTSAAYDNGMTATWTYNADGTSEIDHSGVTVAAFTSYSQENGANGTPTTATYNNGMQAYWTYLPNGSHDVLYTNVTGQPYTAYEMHYGSNGTPTTAFYNNGMMATWTYNADGSYAVDYNGVTGASYSSDTINYGQDGRAESAIYNNGITSTWSYADDGARLVAYQGMSGSAGYTSHASVIDSSGQTVADAEDMNNGSGILRIFANDVTISSSRGSLDVTTAGGDTFGVNTHANETFAASQAHSEAFDFSSGFGATSISGFQIGGAGSDILEFDLSMFHGLSSTNTAAQNLADLLASGSAMQSGQNLTISDVTGDLLTLKNVTTTMLSAAANSVLRFA